MSLTVVSGSNAEESKASHQKLCAISPKQDDSDAFQMLVRGRAFIRHPAHVPIKVSSKKSQKQLNLQLSNVSAGGLSFHSPNRFNEGAVVNISIPTRPVFQVHAIVQWCKPIDEGFELGVKFLDHEDAFRVRMVEQVCHIEDYRLRKQSECGKRVTRNRASREWIARHGGSFPNHH